MLWRFGDCRLDTDRREFVSRGAPAHLTPKAFDLLAVLIQHRPRVLGKGELLDRIWPDTFVAEVNVAVLIAELRAALGDAARAPTFIKTHHGHGYSFIGEVSEIARRPAVPLGGPTAVLRIGTRRIILGHGDAVIGRDSSCEVVINDVSVSRRHAVITVEGGRVSIHDASKNGTRVRGIRIEAPTPLNSGDVITFGNIDADFEIELPDGASTETTDPDTG